LLRLKSAIADVAVRRSATYLIKSMSNFICGSEDHSRKGMTLVELLVVVAIIGVLLAVSVPILRPMLESRKTSNAAQVLAGAFNHARTKAIREQNSYGIRLIPYDEKTAPTACVQLYLQKGVLIDVMNPPDIQVKVEQGVIVPYRLETDEDDGTKTWQQVDWTEIEDVRKDFEEGERIQFSRLGRSFAYSKDKNVLYPDKTPMKNLTLPEYMGYRITKPLETGITLGWRPPTVMPRGTIVDLAFSGGEGEKKEIPIAFSSGDEVEVIVMFSPAGDVDQLYVNGESPEEVNEMLYFCVGDWDRQVNAKGKTLADDGNRNIETPSTYWVTLHPKTGEVRIAENFPSDDDDISKARKFAREHFFNVGN
jgi:prepilin-type N-terminal cleavage/methylation domain-containing protein